MTMDGPRGVIFSFYFLGPVRKALPDSTQNYKLAFRKFHFWIVLDMCSYIKQLCCSTNHPLLLIYNRRGDETEGGRGNNEGREAEICHSYLLPFAKVFHRIPLPTDHTGKLLPRFTQSSKYFVIIKDYSCRYRWRTILVVWLIMCIISSVGDLLAVITTGIWLDHLR